MIYVNEIFDSIQGEGITAGYPATFVRLSGCNLGCVWCDTKYTWHKDYLEKAKKIKEEELAKKLYLKKRIVITGGEPLLQQKALIKLISFIRTLSVINSIAAEPIFEIETALTIMPEPVLVNQIDQWNISPKLSNSGNPRKKRYKEDLLKAFANKENVIFKFVISSSTDIKEIFTDFAFVPRNRIWLMPEGATRGEQINKMSWAVEVVKQYGMNFSPRLQILIYNTKRGV